MPWVTLVSLPRSAEEEAADVADVSRVPADVLRSVEADTYWCVSRLLDGIQVSPAPGGEIAAPPQIRSLLLERSFFLGDGAGVPGAWVETAMSEPTEASCRAWPEPGEHPPSLRAGCQSGASGAHEAASSADLSSAQPGGCGRSCREGNHRPPVEAGNAGQC